MDREPVVIWTGIVVAILDAAIGAAVVFGALDPARGKELAAIVTTLGGTLAAVLRPVVYSPATHDAEVEAAYLAGVEHSPEHGHRE